MPRVGELILLAAPSCCGKTYFLEQLYGGRLESLAQRLGLEEPIDSYISVIPSQLENFRDADVSRMILHFAIPTIALNERSLQTLADESRLDIVSSSDRVTVITLLASANVLASRLHTRFRENRKMMYRKLSKYLSERRRMNRLKQMYAAPDKLVVAYEAWFKYVDSLANLRKSWLVTAENDYEAFEPNEWEQIKRLYFATARLKTSRTSQKRSEASGLKR
jgi:hypothetical protein